jgi:hypothetical protein
MEKKQKKSQNFSKKQILKSHSEQKTPYKTFFLISIVGVESKLGPLGTSATYWPIYLPRVIVRMENLLE